MTDKEVIMIDGLDCTNCNKVSHCNNNNLICRNRYYEVKEELQRKEQECEELRKYHNKCCEEHKKEIEEWLKKYNKLSRDFYSGMYCDKEHCNLVKTKEQENQRLQAENEELNIELNNLKQSIENFCGCKIRDDKTGLPICENADKYKQALETIRNIYDEMNEIYLLDNDILNIINEVLKDDIWN